MQRASVRSLREKQMQRRLDEVTPPRRDSLDGQVGSSVNGDKTPPPLPTEPPPAVDEPECSTPTSSISSHVTLPPNPNSSLPYTVTTTSSKPVASVLPSVYAGSKTFMRRDDTTTKEPSTPNHRGEGAEQSVRPPVPAKPKSVTFSDDVRSGSNSAGVNGFSPPDQRPGIHRETSPVKKDEFRQNSVKNLMSKFEQQSISTSSVPSTGNSAPVTTSHVTPRGYQPPPPYPGHRLGQETSRVAGATNSRRDTGRPAQNGPQHFSQSSVGSDQSTVSTISESSSVLAETQPPAAEPEDLNGSRNWYDSDSESQASLPAVSLDSHGTTASSRYSSQSRDPALSVPVFAQADKIRSIYQSQNGYTSSAFHARDTIEVVTAPDLPGYSQEAGYFMDSGEPSVLNPALHPLGAPYQGQARNPVTSYYPDPVYENLPESNVDSGQPAGSGFSKRQPPPPPLRTASWNFSQFQPQVNGASSSSAGTHTVDAQARNNFHVRREGSVESSNRWPRGSAVGSQEWRAGPPPYHAALSISKLRANGVAAPAGPAGAPGHANEEQRSAFSTTLHVSTC